MRKYNARIRKNKTMGQRESVGPEKRKDKNTTK